MTSASDAMEILAKQEISRNEFKDFIRDLTSSESSLKKGRNIVLERRRHFDVFLEVLCARMNQVPVTERKSMMYLLDMIVTKAHEKHDKKVLAMVQPQLPELFSMMVPVHSAVHAPAAEKLLKRWRQQHVFDDERLKEVEELIDLKRRLKKGRPHREKDSDKKEKKRSSTSRSGEKDKDKVHHHHQRKREHSRGREHGDPRDATASLRAIEADRKKEKRRRLHETKPDGEDSRRASSGSSRLSSAVQHLLQDEPTEIGVAENPSPFRQD